MADARADRQLRVNGDLALIGLRHQLEADGRQDEQRDYEEHSASHHDRRPVVKGAMEQVA